MSTFVGIPPFSNPLWVAIATMHFHIAHTKRFLSTPLFRIQGVPMNNFAPIKNVLGVQGNLNWIPGYMYDILERCFKSLIYMHLVIFKARGHILVRCCAMTDMSHQAPRL